MLAECARSARGEGFSDPSPFLFLCFFLLAALFLSPFYRGKANNRGLERSDNPQGTTDQVSTASENQCSRAKS